MHINLISLVQGILSTILFCDKHNTDNKIHVIKRLKDQLTIKRRINTRGFIGISREWGLTKIHSVREVWIFSGTTCTHFNSLVTVNLGADLLSTVSGFFFGREGLGEGGWVQNHYHV